MSRKNVAAQVARDGLSTPMKGGSMPDKHDIIESANARAQKRHAMKSPSDNEADSLFPGAGDGECLDKAGVSNSGYITKKGTPYGVEAMFNTLPPGMDIEDQETTDIRKMPYREIVGKSYPGDGAF